MSSIQGIIPAIITPVDGDGKFQEPAFEKLVSRLYQAGVHGLYVCGQTGEGLQQRTEQRKAVAEAAVRLSPPDRTVIIHVGAPSTAEAVELARHASKIGAAAVSSLPPAGSYSFEEIKAYYEALAGASAVPLLIYYFPSVAPAIRTTGQILELCAIPNVIGLKFTDPDLFRLWELRQAGAVVMNGLDEMLVAGLLMGANGGIGSIYNLIPERFLELYNCARAGRWQEARQVQDAINEFIAVLLQYPVHPAVKAVLQWAGLDCGVCLPPRRRLSPTEEEAFRRGLAGTNLGRELLARGSR